MDLVEVQLTLTVCYKGRVAEVRPVVLVEVVCFPPWEVEGRHSRVVGEFRLSRCEEAVARQPVQVGHRKIGFERQMGWARGL